MPENQASTSWKCYLMILEWGIDVDLFVLQIFPFLLGSVPNSCKYIFEKAKLDCVKIGTVYLVWLKKKSQWPYSVLERYSGI